VTWVRGFHSVQACDRPIPGLMTGRHDLRRLERLARATTTHHIMSPRIDFNPRQQDPPLQTRGAFWARNRGRTNEPRDRSPDETHRPAHNWAMEILSVADLLLVQRATEIVTRRGDGSVNTVVAAARATDGRIVTGMNVYHFTGGPCAELVLLGNAASEGMERLEVMVAVADRDRGILAPCGRCRQMLLDYQPHIWVIISIEGVGCSVSINELLPHANRWSVTSGSLPSTRRKFS
jgi:cytidine deaminase